ncbi:protein-L-isoaspartate(D-aspartate) O-methyltransferase [bacterium]|nr:protein-L-isoaspartate(D-aspartate) O-methyltransferase [bacterium]MBU1753047.1 protein-L-isoaspartate(D-aspartate) O-methyltransferase [bacterium]
MKDIGKTRFDSERKQMVSGLARRGITDQKVLDAFLRVPRHMFVEDALQDRAYDDHPLPIGLGQTISQPYMVAFMTQILQLSGTERVMEIGTGSGYQAAILSGLVEKVYSVERIKKLSERAEDILLHKLKYRNIVLIVGDGSYGLSQYAPFDRIIVTAGSPSDVPKAMLSQLADGGRLVIPKGDRYTQTLTIIDKKGDEFITSYEGGCVFVPLIGKYGWSE